MSHEAKNPKWQIEGRLYDPTSEKKFKEGIISLPEQTSRLGMTKRPETTAQKPGGPADAIFGMAVDVDLALYLIASFHQKFDNAIYKDLATTRFLNQLPGINYGITFDRSVILKILSQPNCEGLRAYFCYNDDEQHISLVMIGVDEAGYDLNYEIDGLKGENNETGSLAVEYGYPPGGGGSDPDPDPEPDPQPDPLLPGGINEHYILLKRAKEMIAPAQ